MDHSTESQTDRKELKKTMSPAEVWALAVGAIIGWGCFVLPGTRFLPDAGPLGTCLAFLIGGGLLCTVALCYSILIKVYPVAGGSFTYAYVGFGTRAGFICGWALVLGYLCVIAANGTALALLSRFVLPGVFDVGYLYTVAGWDVYAGELAMMSAFFIFFGYMNFRGMDMASSLQLILAFALAGGVLVLILGSVATETSHVDNLFPLFAEGRSPVACVLSILAITPWLFVGFDTIPQTAEEFDFPPEKSRRLMINSIVCGALLYALVLIAVAIIIPYTDLLGQNHSWTTGAVANMAFGRFGGVILAIPVMAGIFTGMNGFFMATTRLLFSMGRGKFLHPWFVKVHPKHDQRRPVHPLPDPHRAVVRPLGPELDRRHVRHGHRARLSVHLHDRVQVCRQLPRHPRSPLGQACGDHRWPDLHLLLRHARPARFSRRHRHRVMVHAARLGRHRHGFLFQPLIRAERHPA